MEPTSQRGCVGGCAQKETSSCKSKCRHQRANTCGLQAEARHPPQSSNRPHCSRAKIDKSCVQSNHFRTARYAGTTSTQGNILVDPPTVNQNGKVDAFDGVNCDQVALRSIPNSHSPTQHGKFYRSSTFFQKRCLHLATLTDESAHFFAHSAMSVARRRFVSDSKSSARWGRVGSSPTFGISRLPTFLLAPEQAWSNTSL